MKVQIYSHYCQKCRTANAPHEEFCRNCGTRLMLVTVPNSFRYENHMASTSYEEHLLERISLLEVRYSHLTAKLGQTLDLMLRQSRTIQLDRLLIETLIDALNDAGIITGEKINENWREKMRSEDSRQTLFLKREKLQTEILSDATGAKKEEFAKTIKDAFHLWQQENEEAALIKFEIAALLEAENVALLSLLGELHFKRDNFLLARLYLEKAHSLAPQNNRTNLILGLICADKGDFVEAENLLSPLLKQRKTAFIVGFALGFVYVAENRLTESLATFKVICANFPTPETHYLAASGYALVKREKLALRHFRKTVELDVNYADAWFMLGSQYLKTGDDLSAKECLAKAIVAKDPEAQCLNFLKNPKKHAELISEPLIFINLAQNRTNLLSGLPARLYRLFRTETEKVLLDEF